MFELNPSNHSQPPAPLPYEAHLGLFFTLLAISGVVFVFVFLFLFVILPIGLKVHKKILRKRSKFRFDNGETEILDVVEFKKVSYRVNVNKKEELILSRVGAKVRAGEMLAILGASGAGKSSFLDIIAGREKIGKVNGEILLNGYTAQEDYKKFVGYVNQDDDERLLGSLTVRESLRYSADLRLPEYLKAKEKNKRVDKMLDQLHLTGVEDRFVGSVLTRGISGGEKKRVVVGMELMAGKQIVILDEPTSGLDSDSAVSVIRTLREICKEQNKMMIFSIHQPSGALFELFDRVLLLHQGKQVLGTDVPACEIKPYLHSLGISVPANCSIPDFLLDVVRKEESLEILQNAEPYKHKPEREQEREEEEIEIREAGEGGETEQTPLLRDVAAPTSATHTPTGEPTMFAPDVLLSPMEEDDVLGVPILNGSKFKSIPSTSFGTQFTTLSLRCFKNSYRDLILLPAHIAFAFIIGLWIGWVYYDLPVDLFGTLSTVGCIFFFCIVLGISSLSSLELFVRERELYVREMSEGLYSSLSYYFAKVLFDIVPLRVIPPIIMSFCVYFLIGFRLNVIAFLWFTAIVTLLNVACGFICLMVATVASNAGLANMISITLIFYFVLFGGLLVNKKTLGGAIGVNRFFSPFNYALEGIISNELQNKWIWFNPANIPDTEYVWMNANYVLDTLDFSADAFPTDVIMLIVTCIAYCMIGAVLFMFFVKEKK